MKKRYRRATCLPAEATVGRSVSVGQLFASFRVFVEALLLLEKYSFALQGLLALSDQQLIFLGDNLGDFATVALDYLDEFQ